MLTLHDVRRGTQRRPVEPEPDYEPPTDDDDEPALAYPCAHCPASFKSAPILRRHLMLNHAFHAVEAEADTREQLETARAAKAAQERIRTAEPDELHPSERPLDESSGPARPSLWPSLPGYLP